MNSEEQRLKCNEHYESPVRKVSYISNSLISINISKKKHPYFCCSIHEEEFQGEFESEEETMAIADEFCGIVFIDLENDDVKSMQFKDEAGVQCNEGMPVSLKYLSSLPIVCKEGKELPVNSVIKPMTHEPLIILPRPEKPYSLDLDEDDGSFQCKFCFKIFITGQALGGHMSRKHPISK